MAYKFTRKKTCLGCDYIVRNFRRAIAIGFQSRSKDLRGHKFKEVRQAETVTMRWLILPTNSTGEKSSSTIK